MHAGAAQSLNRVIMNLLLAVLIGALLAVGAPLTAARAADTSTCVSGGPYARSGAVAEVCLLTPFDATTVSGTIAVSASLTNTGTATSPVSAFGARRMEFLLDGAPLLIDYEAPWEFLLPTTYVADGTHTLQVRALLRDSFTDAIDTMTPPLSVTLAFDNGVATVAPPAATFTPTTGRAPAAGEAFVVAATGDGASGEKEANDVAAMVASWDPNMVLYLGDVYEDGTPTEFFNWYGHDGLLWDGFRSVTNPTLGNHELANGAAPGYDRYWGVPPRRYTTTAGSWEVVTIDSNSGVDSAPGSVQLEWLREQLASSTAACTIAFFHHPVFSVGGQGSNERLMAVWNQLVGAGVDVVLTGHEHNYQRWAPLGMGGVPHPAGPTHFVAGAGGHGVRPFVTTDSRMVVGADTYQAPDTRGSLRLTLGAAAATFEYVTREGLVLDSGTIPCHDPKYTAGSIRNRISLEGVALTSMLPTGSSTLDGQVRAAVGHVDAALADVRWATDERPADKDGHKVIEELRNGVKDVLPSVANAGVAAAVTRLVALGRELADRSMAESRAVYGGLSDYAAARKEYDAGAQALAAGSYDMALDKFRRAFENARRSLAGAPSPWQASVGVRGAIGGVLASTWSRVPSGDGADDSELTSAVAWTATALDRTLWDDESRPSTASAAKVPDALKRTIEDLVAVRTIDTRPTVFEVLGIAKGLAADALAEAAARGGDPKLLAEGEAKLAEGDRRITEAKYRDAADSYKKAFEKARAA